MRVTKAKNNQEEIKKIEKDMIKLDILEATC